jgi:hypothetical protein
MLCIDLFLDGFDGFTSFGYMNKYTIKKEAEHLNVYPDFLFCFHSPINEVLIDVDLEHQLPQSADSLNSFILEEECGISSAASGSTRSCATLPSNKFVCTDYLIEERIRCVDFVLFDIVNETVES